MAYDEAVALLVSLARETEKLDLGAHGAVELTYDELRIPNGRVLARHLHNRWMPADERDPYARLHIVGPLTVRTLGRVFAFTDLQQKDCYVHDLGQHRPSMTLVFHSTGP